MKFHLFDGKCTHSQNATTTTITYTIKRNYIQNKPTNTIISAMRMEFIQLSVYHEQCTMPMGSTGWQPGHNINLGILVVTNYYLQSNREVDKKQNKSLRNKGLALPFFSILDQHTQKGRARCQFLCIPNVLAGRTWTTD